MPLMGMPGAWPIYVLMSYLLGAGNLFLSPESIG